MGVIQFKTKIRNFVEVDGSKSPYIVLKRKVTRADCDLKPHDHEWYNSNLFPQMLQRAYEKTTGGNEWMLLSKLPSGVTVDTSKFLFWAVVTIELPEQFR